MDYSWLGWLLALLMGTVLGLIGGGGSILTLPILVYLFHIEPVLATAYSLFTVGLSALVGSLSYMKRGLLDYKTALLFSIPSFLAIYITRHFVLPNLPETLFHADSPITGQSIFFAITLLLGLTTAALTLAWLGKRKSLETQHTIALMIPAATMIFAIRQYLIPNLPDSILTFGGFTLTKSNGLMISFALVMLWASTAMIKKKKIETDPNKQGSFVQIGMKGLMIGTLTGMVGAGGGFLIIPALVLMIGMEMKKAVGTSLLIISIGSLFGFLGDIHSQPIEWNFLLPFTGLAVVGIFAGNQLSKIIPAERLKKGFGFFVLAMGLATLFKEFFG